MVNNVLNHKHRLSAWVEDWEDWDYDTDSSLGYHHHQAWLQQPGINFMGRVIYRF
jgi:hypothetical protein